MGIILLIVICAAGLTMAFVILFLRFSPSVGKLPDDKEQKGFAGQYYDGRFHNLKNTEVLSGQRSTPSDRRIPKTILPAETPRLLQEVKADDLAFTWLGHSSFLLQTGGMNILADPVLSERTSPVSFAGPKRFSELPLDGDELPFIDVLLLSHDHYDHLDYRTVRKIRDKADVFVVPLGVDAILKGWGISEKKIRALDWWESTEINGTTITLTPSQHFSGRNPLKGNRSLWGGYYVRNEAHGIYYTGDGGYSSVFRDVREKLGAPDLMIAECGQYDTAWADMHMFPEETARAAEDVQAEWILPVHWGAFCICRHAWDDPIRRLSAEARKKGLSLAAPRIGQTVEYREIDSCYEMWWEDHE